mmetsp:Transcript_33248/g.106069  ORF Transcript_33248/g.106069 Transcript_33248/m.106069 type:complete len:200 (-) Transcript_33248:141-740(-)
MMLIDINPCFQGGKHLLQRFNGCGRRRVGCPCPGRQTMVPHSPDQTGAPRAGGSHNLTPTPPSPVSRSPSACSASVWRRASCRARRPAAAAASATPVVRLLRSSSRCAASRREWRSSLRRSCSWRWRPRCSSSAARSSSCCIASRRSGVSVCMSARHCSCSSHLCRSSAPCCLARAAPSSCCRRCSARRRRACSASSCR